MKKLLSLLSILGIALLPNFALAQEGVASNTPPVQEESTSSPVEIPMTDASNVQEATSTQQTIPSDTLESTGNPQESSPQDQGLQDAIQAIDAATAEETASSTATSTEDVIETIEATTTPIAELPIEILKPTKEYTFEVNGAPVAADENPDWSQKLDEAKGEKSDSRDDASVTEAPSLDTATPHVLTVSGECSDPYYVILIYNEASDYDANPASYIFNRAFPCENGRYSYDVKDLPFSLETGTFYLLVAGQGDKGPWKPISALVPLGITVKTIMPEASTTQHESTP